MTSDKGNIARQQQVGSQTSVRRNLLEQNLHTSGKFLLSLPDQMFINIHWMEISLQNLFPFFQKSFFVKDWIEEITHFVAVVK